MILWAGLVLAAEPGETGGPEVAAGVHATGGAGELAGAGWLGHELGASWPVGERWALGAMTDSSFGGEGGLGFGARGTGRYFLGERWADTLGASIHASVGLDLSQQAVGGAGLSIELPQAGRFAGRVSSTWLVTEDWPHGFRVSLQVVVPPGLAVVEVPVPVEPEPVVEVPVVEEPTEPLEPPSLSTDPDEAKVWIPHPVCEWVAASEAEELLAELQARDPEAMVEVIAPGHLPQHVPLEAAVEVELVPAPPVGGLVILAHPGDEVTVDGHPVTLSDDGVAQIKGPPARVEVEIVTGGQRQSLTAQLSEGYVVWMRAHEPEPLDVYFPVGSDRISTQDRRALTAMVTDAGDWSFVLQGSYSPEGSVATNRELALRRARAVADALKTAGLPEDRIAFLDPPKADPNLPANKQRRCTVTPVLAGEEP